MEEQKAAVVASKPPRQIVKPGKTHIRHKRPPRRLSKRSNDVYINRTTQFGKQLARCHRLLDQSFESVTVHGLGSAIHRAINLALQLEETSSHSLVLSVTTSTVQLVDDLEPVDDDTEFKVQSRPNSAIHIHIAKVSPPTTTGHTSTDAKQEPRLT